MGLICLRIQDHACVGLCTYMCLCLSRSFDGRVGAMRQEKPNIDFHKT